MLHCIRLPPPLRPDRPAVPAARSAACRWRDRGDLFGLPCELQTEPLMSVRSADLVEPGLPAASPEMCVSTALRQALQPDAPKRTQGAVAKLVSPFTPWQSVRRQSGWFRPTLLSCGRVEMVTDLDAMREACDRLAPNIIGAEPRRRRGDSNLARPRHPGARSSWTANKRGW